MRILYIHQYFATRRGTTGTRSYEQAKAMIAAGHQVTMLTSSAQLRPEEIPAGTGILRRGRIDGIDLIVLNIPYDQSMGHLQRIAAFLRFMFRAVRIALTLPAVDLILATSTPLTVGAPALTAKLCRSIPYVFEVRDLWPDVPAALGVLKRPWLLWLLRRAEECLYRHARLIVAVNEGVASAIARKSGRRRPIVVVPNACDTDVFGPSRADGSFREARGLAGKVLCIHAGAMGPVNGLDSVLDAAAALRVREDVRFLLVGRGSEKPRLQKRAADERLSNVLFLDPMAKEPLAGMLAACDVGLLTVWPVPLLELNCANKFFDYLASGLPVVLNYEGWQADLLRRHECGLSAPQGDSDAFVGSIRRLADSASLRHEMARRARHLAETHLNRTAVVAPLLKALRDLA